MSLEPCRAEYVLAVFNEIWPNYSQFPNFVLLCLGFILEQIQFVLDSKYEGTQLTCHPESS